MIVCLCVSSSSNGLVGSPCEDLTKKHCGLTLKSVLHFHRYVHDKRILIKIIGIKSKILKMVKKEKRNNLVLNSDAEYNAINI